MPFSELMNDNIEILKADGTRIPGLKACITRNKIHLDAGTLLIQSNDLVIRKMSNGGEETFRVIDPCFYEEFGGIPAHYQMQVQKLGIPEASRAVQSITYNLSGPNARVNIHSVDNSINIHNEHRESLELIGAIREEIAKLNIPDSDKSDAADILDGLEGLFKSGKPKKSVVSALLGALPHVATIASLAKAIIENLQ